ncbi:MAG TPA: NUDIX hydrolase [Candidatus Baltobacteraceae bacterium]|nr:NUDIX hydrolase [Candidatus Baltobacteraceae bacterium]
MADLDRSVPADERERGFYDQLRAFVITEPGCFERTTLAGHITASAWIVDRTGSLALLALHRKLGRWLQLGGHADGDGDLRRVSTREANEESGLTRLSFASDLIYDVDVHEFPARGEEPAHLHYDVRFAFFGDPSEPLVINEESRDLRWIKMTRLSDFALDESIMRMVRKTDAMIAEGRSAVCGNG